MPRPAHGSSSLSGPVLILCSTFRRSRSKYNTTSAQLSARAAHHHLHCFFFLLTSPCPDETYQMWSSRGCRVTARTHVRQCNPSLPFGWCDDPPQGIRALVQDLLNNALPLLAVIVPPRCSTLALSRCPRAEFTIPQEVPPVPFFPCSVCFAHEGTIEAQVLNVRRFPFRFAVCSQLRHPCCSFQHRSGPCYLDCESLPHFSKKVIFAEGYKQLASGGLLSDHLFSFSSVHLCLTLLHPPFITTVSAKIDHARRTFLFRHDGCQLIVLETLLPALLVAHVYRPARFSHRAWDEPQIFQSPFVLFLQALFSVFQLDGSSTEVQTHHPAFPPTLFLPPQPADFWCPSSRALPTNLSTSE